MANNDEPRQGANRGLDWVDLSTQSEVPPAPKEAAAPAKPAAAATASVPVEPRQIAVAVKYEKQTKEAPKIVATGRGAVAEQILQLAFANGVKVREDADLAEVLSHLDVDTPIPLEAYAAVAEILAYVYRANAERR